MSGNIIRQLEERHVAIKVDKMVWSNKIDLLALSNTKGEVMLHRLTWQRVWLLAPPSPDHIVRHLAWRPDGRVIAIAYASKWLVGEVLLVDVENKEILHSVTVTDDVSCLVWLQEGASPTPEPPEHGAKDGAHQFPVSKIPTSPAIPNMGRKWRLFSSPAICLVSKEKGKRKIHSEGTNDFLPKLPSLSRFGSMSDSTEENLEDAKRLRDQTQLNFLLVGTVDGNVYLSVFGLFSCGVMNVNKHMTPGEGEGKYTSVLSAEMSPDMKELYLLVSVDDEKYHSEIMKEENEAKSENLSEPNVQSKSSRERNFQLIILDTRVLSSRSRELHALSLKHGHIVSLLDYMGQTMRSIVEAWENIYLLEIESKLSKHAESLPEGSLSADFLELLLFGVASESLQNFLLQEVNDKGIKKLGQSIELSHSNIQKLILRHLLCVGQNLAYHLAEMMGMAKLTDRFKVLGLDEDVVSKAFAAAGAFLIKATEVQLVIDESMKRYKAFFRWLYAIILRFNDDRVPDLAMQDINQQDLVFIAEYLNKLDVTTDEDGAKKRHCHLDRLGQYLVNQDLSSPLNDDQANPWQALLDQNPCLQDHFSIIKKNKRSSLVQQHELLKAAIDEVFLTPECAIGDMFQLVKTVNLGRMSCVTWTMCLSEERFVLLSMIRSDSPGVFHLVKVSPNSDRVEKSVCFKMEGKLETKCLDVQFYLPELLSVLLEEKDENRNAVIAQFTTKAIYENVDDMVDGHSLGPSVVTRQIPDMVASAFAVDGMRKVAIVLSESRRKVRLFEMEGEDDEEEEEMNSLDSQNSFLDIQKSFTKAMDDLSFDGENVSLMGEASNSFVKEDGESELESEEVQNNVDDQNIGPGTNEELN